jgi:hypothetical protein
MRSASSAASLLIDGIFAPLPTKMDSPKMSATSSEDEEELHRRCATILMIQAGIREMTPGLKML